MRRSGYLFILSASLISACLVRCSGRKGSDYERSEVEPDADILELADAENEVFEEPEPHFPPYDWTMVVNTPAAEADWVSVHAFDQDRVAAIRSSTTVSLFDGALWQSWSFDGARFFDVWADSLDSINVVGALPDAEGGYAAIYHYNGSEWAAWSEFDRAHWPRSWDGAPNNFSAVWGTGPDSIYAVGQEAARLGGDAFVIRNTGRTRWELMQPLPDLQVYLRGIGGRGPDEIYAVGTSLADSEHEPGCGIVWLYDGAEWSEILRDCELAEITDVVAPEAGRPVVCGHDWDRDSRQVLRYDGQQWHAILDLPQEGFYRLAATSSGHVMVAGNAPYPLLVSDSDGWSEPTIGTSRLFSLHGDPGSSVVYAGGPSLLAGTELALAPIAGRESIAIRDVAGNQGDLWAVGDHGVVFRGGAGDGTWDDVDAGTSAWIGGVWAPEPDQVWIVGELGTIRHWDGLQWTSELSPVREHLYDVCGTTSGTLYAVGRAGTILRRQDGIWQEEPASTDLDLHRVACNATDAIYAGGWHMDVPVDRGQILRNTEGIWTIDLEETEAIIWSLVSAAGKVFAVIRTELWTREEGGEWTEVVDAPLANYGWSDTDGSIFVAWITSGAFRGQEGGICRLSGDEWIWDVAFYGPGGEDPTPGTALNYECWGPGPGEYYCAGLGGVAHIDVADVE